MLKAAIEKIEDMSKGRIVEHNGELYHIHGDICMQIRPGIDMADTKIVNSLDAMVQMVKTEAVHAEDLLYVTVPRHDCVECFGQFNPEKRLMRQEYYTARATDIPGWEEQVRMAFDQAAVALQTRFQQSPDRDYALQLLSNITTGAKVTYNDTGVATTVVTQKGVALQQNQTIRPLVKLRPYRTFQEVTQPEGLFLIRIDERGITFTEADGGMWKLHARQTVADFLREKLAQELEDGKVIVTL